MNIRKGFHSQWGTVDSVHKLADGIYSVSTPSHGGIIISPEREAEMPEYMRSTAYSNYGQFEEDCDWCLPFVVFAHLFSVKERLNLEAAKRTMRNWHPDIYERFYGVSIPTGESYARSVS